MLRYSVYVGAVEMNHSMIDGLENAKLVQRKYQLEKYEDVAIATFLLCNECGEELYDDKISDGSELRDLAFNKGWKERPNDIDLCEQCRHITNREGE